MVSVALWLFLLSLRTNATALIFFNLPATICHELAHWLVALVTGSRPGIPSLLPRKEGTRWVLGTVVFEVRPLAAGFVALAPPLLLAPVAWLGLVEQQLLPALTEAARGVVFGYVAWGALPSGADLAIALRNPLGAVLAAGVFVAMTSAVL